MVRDSVDMQNKKRKEKNSAKSMVLYEVEKASKQKMKILTAVFSFVMTVT